MRSPIYWHPAVYTCVMKILCDEGFYRKYDCLKREIGDFPVLDIGCGDCYLSRYVPKANYSGLDINETFVRFAQKKGLNVNRFDLRRDPIPETEIIVLSNVLHQLYPQHEKILENIVRSAGKKAIVCEPMHHVASSSNRFISWFARKMNDPGYGSPVKRLSREELFALFERYHVTRIEVVGREAIAVFEK